VVDRIIKCSTNANDLILIPFAGSGSEFVSAINLKRKSIGIEKEKQYYDVAVRRALEYCG